MTRPALILAVLALSVAATHAADSPPPIPREFRAAWVATVANIDWPSKPGLDAETQKAELLKLFDELKALNFNAVVLQVRPMCDAFYQSDLEPWSEFLTGTSGKSPGYDPLTFAVTQAHQRGLELHAWFNPYRARSPAAKSDPTDRHLVKSRPDLARAYGKHYWLNPTDPEVSNHSLKVIADVVKRYDIDGIHMDDYFYPYPEMDDNKNEIPFPDDETWEKYQSSGGKLSRDDWRRDAVNQFVEKLYAETKAAKPHVQVGISPFGIWRPGHPEGIKGFDQYGKLYADAKLWLNKGWVDYYTPQLYWPITQEAQSYTKLLNWWLTQNTEKRHLWPGLYTSKMAGKIPGYTPEELGNEIRLTREVNANGNVHFSAKPMLRSAAIVKILGELYAEPALVPSTPWLKGTPPGSPTMTQDAGMLKLQGDANTTLFTVQTLAGAKWQNANCCRGPVNSQRNNEVADGGACCHRVSRSEWAMGCGRVALELDLHIT